MRNAFEATYRPLRPTASAATSVKPIPTPNRKATYTFGDAARIKVSAAFARKLASNADVTPASTFKLIK